MGTFLNGLAALGAIAGGVQLFWTFIGAASAPQQAAGAAMAAALAVIPYVLARVFYMSKQAELEEVRYSRMLEALKDSTATSTDAPAVDPARWNKLD